MTPSGKKLVWYLIKLFVLLSWVHVTDESDGGNSAFLNESVTLSDCTEDVHDYRIDGKGRQFLSDSFLNRTSFVTEDSCHTLTFPALPTSSNGTMVISFIRADGSEINCTLHVQGVPKQPDNFTFHDVNATHINLVWDEPFSWVMPANITYVLVLEGPYIPKTIELSTHSFPLLRAPGGLYARLTPRNPVGEGESTTLNLTDLVLGCDKIGDFTPEALPHYNSSNVSVMVELFTLEESGRYCLAETVVVNINGRETHSAIEIKDGKAVLVFHGVPEEIHVTATIPYFNSEFNFSTYKVQGITESGSSHEPIVECHFLTGSDHNTCYIAGAGDESSFSGDARYTITRPPGQYTLLVYDSERQKNTGKNPALMKNITIEYKKRESSGGDGGLYTLIVLLIGLVVSVSLVVTLSIIWGCWKKWLEENVAIHCPGVGNVPTDHTSDNVQRDHTSPGVNNVQRASDGKTMYHPTEIDEGPDLVIGKQRSRVIPGVAHNRTEENHVAIPMDAIQEEQGQRDEAVQAMVGRAEENPQNPPVLMEENHVAIPMDAMQEEQGRLDTAVQATVVHAEENSPVLTEVEIQADVVNGVEHGALHPAPEQEHAN